MLVIRWAKTFLTPNNGLLCEATLRALMDANIGKEMMISLLGAWKIQLVRLKVEIDQALGDLLEGLNGFGLWISKSQACWAS